MDLIEFLRARLDEDEQIAHAAMWDDQAGAWTYTPPQDRYSKHTVNDYLGDVLVVVAPYNADEDGIGAHVERHDPQRILAEVDAKRMIIADYERFLAERRRAMGGWDSYPDVSPTMAALASVYADHPDYREEWRP